MKLLLSIAIIVALMSTVSMYVHSMFGDQEDVDYCHPDRFDLFCTAAQLQKARCVNGIKVCPIVPWNALAGGEIECPIPGAVGCSS